VDRDAGTPPADGSDPRIAELERRVAELARANESLAESSRMKSEFLANMSHELRSPLTAIIGFSEVLRDELFGPVNARQREHITHIWESGRRLLDLIEDILDLSRIEAGKATLDKTDAYPRQVVEAVVVMVRQLAFTQGIQLDWAVAPEADVPCLIDARKIKQVLFHLLTASVKMCQPGGVVRLAATVEGADARFAVSDSGPGLTPQDAERAFTEFAKLEVRNGTFRKVGVGLSLARRLAHMHGAAIALRVEPGAGNTFTLTIPGCVAGAAGAAGGLPHA
jgi:signal transduction histidine kinase